MSVDISNNLHINIEEAVDKEEVEIFKIAEQLAKGGNTAETSASLIKERWELGEFLGFEDSEDEGSLKTTEDKNKREINDSKPFTKMAPIHRIMDPKIDNLKNEYTRTSYHSDSDSGDECNNIKREFEQLVNENEIADIYRINNLDKFFDWGILFLLGILLFLLILFIAYKMMKKGIEK